MVYFHDATKLNGARKSDTHLKRSTSIFLSFFLLFFLIGWEEAVLLFGIIYLKGRRLLAVFLGVYALNFISLVGVVMPEHNSNLHCKRHVGEYDNSKAICRPLFYMGFPVFAGAYRVQSSAKNSHKVEAEATSGSFVSVIRKPEWL